MADDFLDGIVDAGTAAAPAPVETPQAAPQAPAPEMPPATSEGQPRAADGKFASKEVAPPPEATPQPTDQKPRVDPEQFRGYLDERDKRKAADERAARAEQRARELEERLNQPSQIPSASDPEALARYIDQQKTSTVFDVSETMAREKHGDEPVAQAMDWALQRAQQSPAFAAEYLKQRHPIDWAVKQHKRDAVMNDVGDDPDAYVRRRAAELGLTGTAPATQAAQPSQAATPQPMAPAPAPAAPPRSLASAPAAGAATSVPTHAVAAVDAIFQ